MGKIRGPLLQRMSAGLRRSAALLPLAMAAGAFPALAQSLEPAGNVIIPDGRTATELRTSGATTDITTGTMAGGNAYNSFSQFKVGENNTVNLHVPGSATYLINIVRDGPVMVDGTLNALKDGRIDGNVVFSDPYGFIVSEKGSVNAGSLTVNTPTKEFLEQVIDPAGRVDTALGARLIDGDVPLSPDGSIVIRGKVKTKRGVSLKANSVTVGGPEEHAAQFEATVNTGGRKQGAEIVVRNGKISIVAAGKAKVGGALRAGGGRKRGGEIEIIAADAVTILPTARIEALRAREADTLFAASDAVRRASGGKVSITSAGVLDVAGSILAEGSVQIGGAVNLSGARVGIAGGADIAVTTVMRGAAAAVETAKIKVRSAGDLTLAGTLTADGATGAKAGAIDITAGNDIALAGTTHLSVAGAGSNSSAGSILVFADRDLEVANGVKIKAGAGTSGNGGFVELSSKRVVSLAALDVDLWAEHGRVGTLYIDPVDIIIGAGTASGDTQYLVNYVTNGGHAVLDASNSITVKSGFRIDTRRIDGNGISTGDSGNVTLTAPHISVENGGSILAGVNNQGGTTYNAGDVSLLAEQTRTDLYGAPGETVRVDSSISIAGMVTGKTIRVSSLADYAVNSLHAGTTSTITISGNITGTLIDVLSKARAVSNFNDASNAFGVLDAAIQAINPLGVSAAWVSASASAYLNVTGTANITGATVKLQTDSTGVAQDSAVGLNVGSSTHLSIPVIVGMVETVAKTDIGQAAQLSVSESLGVAALTDTKLNILSQVISGAPFIGGTGAPVVVAVAYGGAKVDASAVVRSNTTINGNAAVTVLARSDNAFSVNAKVYGRGQAQVGGTLAISEVDSKTVARLGAHVDNTGAALARDVTVQALSNVATHDTSAGTVVGSGDFSDILQGIGTIGNLIGGAQLNVSGVGALILDKLMASPAASATNLGSKTAGSLALAHGSITADASISGDGPLTINPSVKAKGTVTVVSDIYSRKIVSNAASGINSTAKDPTSTSTGGEVGSAVAVAIFEVGHYARAYLGNNSRAEGTHVAINASMSMTSPILISNWDSFGQVFVDAANGFLANPSVFTSGAKATAESNNASQAGSYDHFEVGVDILAWVGNGARIVSTGAAGNWSAYRLDALDTPDTTNGQPDRFNFQTAVDIAATSRLESLSVIGNWGLTGNQSGGAAVGGSAGFLNFDVATIAGIADSAMVTAAQAVDVEAKSTHFHLAISPSNGTGKSVAGSGLVAFVKIDDRTQASISNRATVTGDIVSIKADEVLGVYAASGQLQYGNGASVGVAVSIVEIDTDTAAFVGNNIGAAGDIDSQTLATTNLGKIVTNEFNVRAATSGTVLVTTIAAALSQPVEAPPPGTPSKALEMLGGSQATAVPKFNLSISGSSSVLINALATGAYLDGAKVERRTAGGGLGSVAVQALNTVKAYAISGSAAVALGGGSSLGSGAVAGAIALGSSDNRTIASIAASDIDDVKIVVVQGLAGGTYTVSAVGLTATTGNSDLFSLAGSVSIALIEDTVQAVIRGSSIDAQATAPGDLSVFAYRRTEVSIGGGSLGLGGKSGAGVALTYTTIRDSAAGAAALALVANSNIRGFVGLSVIAAAPSRIYSGAAAASILSQNGFSGAFVVNDIGGTVMASIEADQDDKKVNVSGQVAVKAGTANTGDLDSLLAAATRGGPASINDYSQVTYENAENGSATEVADGAAIVAIAGNISVGDRNIGASVINNTIHQSHVARIAGVEIDTGNDVHVLATDETSILALGIGVGVATGQFAGNAAIVNNSVTSSISTEVGKAGRRTDIDARGLYMTAQDAVVIRGSATAAAVSGGGAAVGVGIAVNSIAMDVGALVNNAKLTASGSVEISANSKADILTIAAGVGGGSTVGLAGSAASSKIGTNVRARIIGASDVDAGNNVILDARNTGRISVIAGALGVGLGGAGAGLSVVVNEVGGDTESAIADSTVDADGNGTAKSVRAGELATRLNPGAVTGMGFSTPDLTQRFMSISGVAVLANSTRTVTGVVITLGIAGGGPAAAILPIATIAGGRTVAVIDRSNIDTRLGRASNVYVSASSHSFAGNLAIGGAVSTAASAGAATSITTTMNRSTEARVADSNIGSAAGFRPALLAVEAIASQSASDIATGLSAALVGGAAGSAVVTVFNATTKSLVEGGAIYAGDAAITAKSTNGYFAAAGSGAGGLFGGAAGAFVVGVSKNTTIARVGAIGKTTAINLNGDLVIDARSLNAFTSHAYGAAGAVIGGAVAAMSLVTVVGNDTEALLRNVTITIAPGATIPIDASTSRPAGISVTAFEDLVTKAYTGGGGLAVLGNGLGAAANVIILTSKVQADSSGGSIAAPGDFFISATTDKKVDARTVTLGAGMGNGIGASVAVVIAGGATAGDALAELNKDGNGTLAMINSASAAAADFVLETGNLGTWRGRAGAGTTDAQVQAWARERYRTLIQQGSFDNDGVYLAAASLSASAQAQALADFAALTRDRALYVLADDQLVAYAAKTLGSADAAAFQRISDINTATGVIFTPKQGSLAAFSAEVKTALGLSTDPTDAQIRTYLETRYQGFVAAIRAQASADYVGLLAKGTVANGRLIVSAAEIGTLAASTLSTADASLYYTLFAAKTTAADFTLNDVDAIYTGTKTYRQFAAETLDQNLTGSGNDAKVQEYWRARYNALVSAIESGADSNYRSMAANRYTAQPNFSVTNAASNASEGIYAGISGGSVTVRGLAIDATSGVGVDNTAWGGGIGGFGTGVGAAVAYTESNAAVQAYAAGNITANVIEVTALARDKAGMKAANTDAQAGAGGLMAGIGAAVATSIANNTVSALLGGTITGTGADASVTATALDTTTIDSQAVGAAVAGGTAVGASVATSKRTSHVTAATGPAANITGWKNVEVSSGAGAINSNISGFISAKAYAGAGGIGTALAGAVATAISVDTVTASLGAGTVVSATSTKVNATTAAKVKAETIGVAVSGNFAMGASVSTATSNSTINAYTEDNVDIRSGTLDIAAMAGLPLSGDTGWSRAAAGTGGALLGANATVAIAKAESVVQAWGGRGLRLPAGNVSISAVNESQLTTEGTGIAVGFIGAGATVAESRSKGKSEAWLEDGAVTATNRAGALSITAEGKADNSAKSTAGSGGVVAGSASVAITEDKSSATAELRSGSANYTLYTGGLAVESGWDSKFASNADAYQASAIGMSGAFADNDVDTDVATRIGGDMIVHSTDNVFISATTLVEQNGGGARSGSGGMVGAAAARSDTDVTNDTDVFIGNGTIISLNGDPTTFTGKMDIEVYNELAVGDTATVHSGGYFAGGGAVSEFDATIRTNVSIGSNVTLFSIGALQVGTASVNSSNNRANASLYGVVTGAGATTWSKITATQNLDIGASSTLEAIGSITVTAGRTGNGFYSSMVAAMATTEVYNYALIPITAAFKGDARGYNNVRLTMGAGGRLLAGRDITVGSYGGNVNAVGKGTNHNPYLALFNTTKSDNNSDFSSTAKVVLNGTITAGLNNSLSIIIDANGNISPSSQTGTYALAAVAVGDVGMTFITYNDRKIRYNLGATYNPYADVVQRLSTLTGLDTATVRARLAARSDMLAGVGSLSDDSSRQVETFVRQIGTGSVPDQNIAGTLRLGDMMAQGGNVTINAAELSGAATVTAKGTPRIEVTSNGRSYMLLNKLLLATNEGGQITYTGGVSGAAGIDEAKLPGNGKPEILVRSLYPGDVDPFGNITIPSVTPDIYFLDDVSNLVGAVTIRNSIGNVTTLSPVFEAAIIDMEIPRGNLTVNLGAGTVYDTNNSVPAQWRGTQIRPGSAASAVEYVASYLEGNLNRYSGGGALNGDAEWTARTLGLAYFAGGYNGLYSRIYFKAYDWNQSYSTQTGQTGGWEKGWYRGVAYPDSDSSGPFAALRFDVIHRQVLSKTASEALSPPERRNVLVGGSVIISASTINVNGTIQTGFANSWSVVLDGAAAGIINTYKNSAAQRTANAGRYIELPGGSFNLDTYIRAFYDVSNDRIELQNVVQGSGGRVYLNGGIISTSTKAGESQGLIRVNGGYATANIINNTGTTLMVNTINTGVPTSSVVEIVDHYKIVNGAPLRTWYVYDVSKPFAVTKYERTGTSTSSDYTTATVVAQGDGQNWTYAPDSDLIYRWVDTATAVRAKPNTSNVNTDWSWQSSATDPYTTTVSVIRGQQAENFRETITGSAVYERSEYGMSRNHGTDFNGTWYQDIATGATITLTNTVKASNPIGILFVGGSDGSVRVTSNATVIINGVITNYAGTTAITATGAASQILTGVEGKVGGKSIVLVGDGGIGSSSDALKAQLYGGTLTATSINSDINIEMRGNAVISGIAAGAGDVTLKATGDITAASAYNVNAPIIRGASIRLDSESGAIGARSSTGGGLADINPIIVQTGAGGVLDSAKSAAIYVAQTNGDLRVGRIVSNGSVYLAANQGSILRGNSRVAPTEQETARLIDLWTLLNLLGTAAQDGTYDVNGVLNTAAYAGSAAVHGYEAMVNRAYHDYWQLKTLLFNANGEYAPTDAGKAAIEAQLSTRLAPGAEIDDDDVRDEALRRFGSARFILGLSTDKSMVDLPADQLAVLSGAPTSGTLTAGLSAYDKDFSYKLGTGTAVYSALTSGSAWTQDQLTYTIDSAAHSAAEEVLPTLNNLRANIEGREVMLYAPNGSIGSLAPSRTITFTSDNLAGLGVPDREAISNAGPGDLTVETSTAGGVTTYTVTLADQNLVVADALGGVTATAGGSVYLGNHLDLKIGGVSTDLLPTGVLAGIGSAGVRSTAGGDVRLEARGDIYGANPGQTAISGVIGRLTLISETGSVGRAGLVNGDPWLNTSALYVDMAAAGGTFDLVQARQGVFLRQLSGDMILGNIVGGSGAAAAVQLGTTGNIYAQVRFTNPNVAHIIGSSLHLRSGGRISYDAGGALRRLQVNISGAVTGVATGDINLASPVGSMIIGTGQESHQTLTTNGNIVLDGSGGSLTLNRTLMSGGSLTLVANAGLNLAATVVASALNGGLSVTAGSLDMGLGSQLTATGAINIVSTGHAVLGRVATSLNLAISPVISITSATGSIRTNGGGGANLVTLAGAGIDLSAGNAIDLAVDTSWARAQSTSGDLALRATGGLKGALIKSAQGAVSLTGPGFFDLTEVVAGTSVRIASSANRLKLGTIAAGTSVDLDAEGDIDVVALTAGGRVDGTSANGKVTIGSSTSEGTQDWQAKGDILFTTIRADGIAVVPGGSAGDPGDILLTSSTGDIIGNPAGSTLAGSGGVKLAANTLALDSFSADWADLMARTGNIALASLATDTYAMLKAGGSIGVQTLRIGTSLTSEAGTTTDFDDLIAGTFIDVTSAGLVDIASGEATGSAKIKSTAGKVKLGTLKTGTYADIEASTDIKATTLTIGGALEATATTGRLTIGSATSVAAQLWQAAGDIAFTTLKATGTGSSIEAASTAGSIIGDVAGNLIEAAGLAKLSAVSLALDVVDAGTAEFAATGTSVTGTIGVTRLTTGTTAELDAGGAITVGTLDIGTSLISHAGATTTFTDLDAGTFIDVTSVGLVDIASGEATTGSAKVQSTAGKVKFGSLTAGTSADIDAHTDIEGTTLTTGTTAELDAGGAITVGTLHIGSSLVSHAGITTDFNNLDAGTFIDVTSVGLIDIASGEATTGSAKVQSTAGKVKLGTLKTGTYADIEASTDIEATTLTIGGALDGTATTGTLTIGSATSLGAQLWQAGGNIAFTTLEATGTGSGIEAASIAGSIIGDVAGNLVEADGLAKLSAVSLALDVVDAGTAEFAATGTSVTGTIGVTRLTTGTSAELDAGGAITVGTLDIGSSLTSNAGATTTFIDLLAGTFIDVTSAGLIHIASGEATTGYAKLQSTAGKVKFGSLTAGTSADIDAQTDIEGTTLTTGTTAELDAGGAITVSTLDIGSSLISHAGATTTFTDLDAGTFIDVTSVGLVDIASGEATTGSAKVQSTIGKVKFGSLTAATSADIDAHTDIEGTTLTTGTTADLDAGSAITVGTLGIGTSLTSEAGTTTDFDDLIAGTFIDVTSAGLVDIASGEATGSAKIKSTAGKVKLGTLKTGTYADIEASTDIKATTLTIGGALEATATTGRLTIGSATSVAAQLWQAAGDIAFTTLKATGTGSSIEAASTAGSIIGDVAGNLIEAAGLAKLSAVSLALDVVDAGTAEFAATGTSVTGTIGVTRLTTGTTAELDAGGAITVGTLDIGTSLISHAGATTTFTDLDAGTFIDVTSVGLVDIASGEATTGSAKVQSTAGKVKFGSLTAGTSADIDAHTDIEGTTLTTGTTAELDAGGAITVGTLHIGSSLVSHAGITTDFNNLDAGTFIDVTSVGLIDIASGEATTGSAKVQSTAGKVKLGTLKTGTYADIEASTDIEATTLTTGTTAELDAGGSISAQALRIGTSLTSHAGATTTLTDLDAGTFIDVTSGGLIQLVTARADSDWASVRSTGGAVNIGMLDIGTSAFVSASSQITLQSITAGTDVELTAGDTLDIAALTSGGNAKLNANRIVATGMTTGGGAILISATSIEVGALDSGGSMSSAAGTTTNFGRVRAAGLMTIHAAGAVSLDDGRADGSATLVSTNDSVTVNLLSGAAGLTLRAADTVEATTLVSGGSTMLAAVNVLVGSADAALDLNIDGSTLIDATDLAAGGLLSLENGPGGSIRLDRASATRMRSSGSESFSAQDLRLVTSGSFSANDMLIARLTHTGSGDGIALDFYGAQGGSAMNLALSLSANDVVVGDYRVVDATIDTDGTLLSIARGYVEGTMTLKTAVRKIFMNNRRVTPVTGNDVQLFQPSFAFKLKQENFRTTTNAFIVQFGPGSEVFFERDGLLFQGLSMVRELETALASATPGGSSEELATFAGGQLQHVTAAFMARFLTAQTQKAMIVREDDDEPAVNLQR
jgi:filamentous hemagglutinin family protein